MSGKLFVVATPIGNLEDITLRALRILKEVALIACEDTRHTRRLLAHFAISTPTISYHDHNARLRAPQLLDRVEAGEDVALVSDAGTPAISDPGYRLISGAAERQIPVVPVPGASAAIVAISASGLPTDEFYFAGFPPAKQSARRAWLTGLASIRATLVFYESPHRIAETLADLCAAFGDRRAVIARELTKIHEEFLRGTLSTLRAAITEENRRGEFVVLVDGAPALADADVETPIPDRVARLESEGLSRMDAMKRVARERGMPKRDVYRLVEIASHAEASDE